jgi:RNA polymerase sigma-70 factor (ECF subfamily)
MGEWQPLEGRIEPSDFEAFFVRSERPVRFALCARFGFDAGRDATAEAFAYAWEHWNRVAEMENPIGYVYRVGQRAGQRMSARSEPVDFSRLESELPVVEPKLAPALSQLSARQRTAVVLVHGLGWTHRETAELLGLSSSTVQKHVERGVEALRRVLGVELEH